MSNYDGHQGAGLRTVPGTRDRVIKRRFLQPVAVPEYWVVDLSPHLVERWQPCDPRCASTLI